MANSPSEQGSVRPMHKLHEKHTIRGAAQIRILLQYENIAEMRTEAS